MSSYAAVTVKVALLKVCSAFLGAYFNAIVALSASVPAIVNFLPAAVISLSAARVTASLRVDKSAVIVTASPVVPLLLM